jgi:GTP-sensing pleiotropic transcriptional regulator CodY
MFQAYFWKTFYSFLYGDAKNVQEMLLIHLLKDKYDIVGYFCIAKQNQENLVLENRNRKFKYSIKRFLEMIMNEYDISANSSMDQFRTAYIIEKDKTLGGKEETFEKVRSACEKMGYTDSYLYQNCKNI